MNLIFSDSCASVKLWFRRPIKMTSLLYVCREGKNRSHAARIITHYELRKENFDYSSLEIKAAGLEATQQNQIGDEMKAALVNGLNYPFDPVVFSNKSRPIADYALEEQRAILLMEANQAKSIPGIRSLDGRVFTLSRAAGEDTDVRDPNDTIVYIPELSLSTFLNVVAGNLYARFPGKISSRDGNEVYNEYIDIAKQIQGYVRKAIENGFFRRLLEKQSN